MVCLSLHVGVKSLPENCSPVKDKPSELRESVSSTITEFYMKLYISVKRSYVMANTS